jgi:hypothetical protein
MPIWSGELKGWEFKIIMVYDTNMFNTKIYNCVKGNKLTIVKNKRHSFLVQVLTMVS